MPMRFARREALTEKEQKRVEGDQADFAWLAEHAQEIEARYRGKYIAVVNSTLFVGESYEEVREKASAACPDKEPFVEQVPIKRRMLVV